MKRRIRHLRMRRRLQDGNKIAAFAALSGAMAVIAGAFGSHGAQGQAAEWLKTGGQYQMVHAIAALIASLMVRSPRVAGLFVAGSMIFALTLYLMALGLPRWLGAVTPIGGVLMILGWISLAGCLLVNRGPDNRN